VSETPVNISYVRTRERVRELLEIGMAPAAVARRLGLTKSTVAYHARRLGRAPDERFNRRYDWAAIQRYYDEGHSKRECERHFGFASETWHSAVRRGAIVPRPHAMPIEELLSKPRNRNHIKMRLVAAGLKRLECEECGLSEWQGAPIPLELHHINGRGDDNRLENLQLLCANCHSQTDTWGGRNIGRLPAA
jgi:5-methylcytosine-specific restriction endonuclease McrA